MLAGKQNFVDSYYATVLDQDYNVEWETTNDLEISNESFNVSDIALNNKGNMYIAFFSKPKDEKKSADKKSYIDLIYLTDGEKDRMTFNLNDNYFEEQIRLKALKNNDIYLAGLCYVETGIERKKYFHRQEFISIKIDGNKFNVVGDYKKDFYEEWIKGQKRVEPTYVPNMRIINMLELNNGDVAVVCEQVSSSIIISSYYNTYIKSHNSVTTIFVKGDDGSIEHTSTMRKVQYNSSKFECPSKALHLSIFPFVYGNKVGYIFNDCLKRYAKPHKYKMDYFESANGDDAAIVLNIQESGEKDEITVLTGDKLPAKRLVRQILFEENDRLIVLTRNKKEAYIETLSLP
jgi:putative component of toxin-antitoxin plasmid stabilization module